MKDLIIIGAGPGGLSAAIYGKRAGLDLLVIEKFAPGGQVMNTAEVENYPGFVEPIAGWELVSAMENQARRLEAEIVSAEIANIEKDDKNDKFIIKSATGEIFESKAVIVATGSNWRKLGVPGELELASKGVSYCATCDGAFFKDKITAVVGGGNTALDEAIFLTKFSSKVYLIHRRDKFRGSEALQKVVKDNPRIEIVHSHVVETINGTDKVESITVSSTLGEETQDIAIDGIFIFVGVNPQTEFLPDQVLDENKMVKVNMQMETPIAGLYAIGDIRQNSRRQIVTAAGDGAVAAMSAYEYITHNEL